MRIGGICTLFKNLCLDHFFGIGFFSLGSFGWLEGAGEVGGKDT